MADGYLILDDGDRVVDSNTVARTLLAAACTAVGDADDVVGTSIDVIVDGITFVEGEEAPLDEGQFVVEGTDGRRHVSLQTTILEDDGFSIGRLVTLRDVTTKVRAERQLRQERREFETLFTNMTDPVAKVEYGPDGPIVRSVNPAFTETFGYTAGDAVGRSIHDLLVPEERRATAADLSQQVQAGATIRQEVLRLTDEDERIFLLRSAPVDQETEPTTAYLIYTDITDEKRRQRELERQNQQLDQFASIVSHDLRNPLNVARGLLETSEAADVPGSNVNEAIKSLDRMEAMIADVLTLARQGHEVGEPDPVTLDAAARMAWENVDTRDATLELIGSRTFRADPDRLLQLFENCFRNSIEHGGDSVTVSVGPIDEPERTGFYVADDGPGIPESQREAVFEHGHTTNPKGTGFGLSIIRQIVTAHGWQIAAAESESGGARFEVTGVAIDVGESSDVEPDTDSTAST